MNPEDFWYPGPEVGHNGPSIRTMIAMRILQGLVASGEQSSWGSLALKAVTGADALILELNKQAEIDAADKQAVRNGR